MLIMFVYVMSLGIWSSWDIFKIARQYLLYVFFFIIIVTFKYIIILFFFEKFLSFDLTKTQQMFVKKNIIIVKDYFCNLKIIKVGK